MNRYGEFAFPENDRRGYFPRGQVGPEMEVPMNVPRENPAWLPDVEPDPESTRPPAAYNANESEAFRRQELREIPFYDTEIDGNDMWPGEGPEDDMTHSGRQRHLRNPADEMEMALEWRDNRENRRRFQDRQGMAEEERLRRERDLDERNAAAVIRVRSMLDQARRAGETPQQKRMRETEALLQANEKRRKGPGA